MKKIVGILAAAAVAASAFAIDFSAGIKMAGSLFNYDGSSKGVTAFKIGHTNSKDDKPVTFSLSSDRAGGTLKFYDAAGAKETNMIANYWNIWFKPFDMVKIDLGNCGKGLNTETITYWRGKVFGNTNDFGYQATLETNGITVALGLLPGHNAAWMSLPNGGAFALDETQLYFAYAADFGTISVLFDAKQTFKDISVGAGYKGSFDSLTIFADVAFFAATTNSIAVDFDAKYSQDAITIEGYVKWGSGDLSNLSTSSMSLMAMAKFAYALNGGSLYVKFIDLNAFDFVKNLNEVSVGYAGSVGAMGYDVKAMVSADANGNISFGIPVEFTLSF